MPPEAWPHSFLGGSQADAIGFDDSELASEPGEYVALKHQPLDQMENESDCGVAGQFQHDNAVVAFW